MPPVKPQPWKGARDVFHDGTRAPQIRGPEPEEVLATDPAGPMGEDCLVLNVWTPEARAGQKLPVMVWFHGGGYATGSGSWSMYDGKEAAEGTRKAELPEPSQSNDPSSTATSASS